MHRRTLTAIAIAAFSVASPAALAASASAALPSRPSKADWQKIQTAASLRKMALARHRTARFRSFTASLGLGQLASVHPLAPGRCRNAVTDLYNNLLDLENAFPGENWNPLRRAVAKEPSIHACAPRQLHGTADRQRQPAPVLAVQQPRVGPVLPRHHVDQARPERQRLYPVTPGFDLATGIGSPIMASIITGS